MLDLRPAFATLMAILLVLGVFLNYGHATFYRDPGSMFFKPDRANERKYSLVRERQGEAFLETARAGGPGAGFLAHVDAVDICVGVSTVRREGAQVVDLTLATLLADLDPREKHSIYTTVLFAHADPAAHPSWAANASITAWVEDAWSYADAGAPDVQALVAQLAPASTARQIHAKSMLDYTLVLERCLHKTQAPYVAVFEDDVLVAKGWVARTLDALRAADAGRRDWLDVRLFNQERSTGWATRRVGGNHELLIIAALDLVLLAAVVVFRGRMFSTPVLLLVLTLGVPLGVVLFFQTGKASLLPHRAGIVPESFGCCSQALVFSRRHVPDLIQYLRDAIPAQIAGGEGQEDEQYDMRTRDFAAERGLQRMALYPMQAQHVGRLSSVGASVEAASSVWSMAFEDLRQSELDWAWKRAMERVYGSA